MLDEVFVEKVCEHLHDVYEAAAEVTGWQTQKVSRMPWADVPKANKETMRIAVRSLLLYIADPSRRVDLDALMAYVDQRVGSRDRSC